MVNGFQTVLQDITRSMESNDIFRSDTPQSLVMSVSPSLPEVPSVREALKEEGREGGRERMGENDRGTEWEGEMERREGGKQDRVGVERGTGKDGEGGREGDRREGDRRDKNHAWRRETDLVNTQ